MNSKYVLTDARAVHPNTNKIMKKIFATIFAFIAIASMTMLSSCGGAPSNEEVGEIIYKYESHDKLSERDYGTLIRYISAAVDDIAPINKEMLEVAKKIEFPKINIRDIWYFSIDMSYTGDLDELIYSIDPNKFAENYETLQDCTQKIEKVGEKYEYLKQAQQIVKYSGTYMGEPNHDKVMELRERIEKENIDAPFLFI